MDKWIKILQTVPSSIRTGYALMALAFVLTAFLASIGKLTPDHFFYLSLAMFAVALLGVFLLKDSDFKVDKDASLEGHDILSTKLTTFADNANRPIYIVDDQFIVKYCNDHFLDFIGARREHVIGKRIETVIELFEKLVPEERREAFRRRQAEVVKKAAIAPYASISEVVDLSDRTSGDDRNMFRVWIQADFIYSEDEKRSLGSVVIYHPVAAAMNSEGMLILPEIVN